jgi:hypothetical protein
MQYLLTNGPPASKLSFIGADGIVDTDLLFA